MHKDYSLKLDTPEILNDSSDEVLRTLGLTGGQITRIRNGLKLLKDKEIQDLTLDLEVQPLTSTLSTYYGDLPLLSTPNSSNHSSRSVSPVFLPEKKAVPPAKLAFKDEETRATAKENWITSFTLPTLFSPSLADGLQKKSLDSKQRNEFNRDVCAAIKVHTLFPTKEERQRVAYLIIEKYPFLADTLGSGTQSWTVSIKNYFKNIRKTKRTPGSKATSGPEPPPKKMKKGGQVPSYAEGETESTCKEHMASLKKEKNSNRNLQMVKQLMEITYPYRRRMILTEPLSIPEIMDKFPALNLVTEFKLEVSRVLGSGTVKDCWEVWEENWLQKVLRLAMKTPACCYIQTTMEEALEETPDKRKDIEDSAAILFLEKMST